MQKQYYRFIRRSGAALALLFLAMLAFPAGAAADAQGFTVLGGGTPQTGTLMSLSPDPGVIEAADGANASSLVGVIDPDVTPLDLQPGQTSVATGGAATALVSTLNGVVHVGDRIAPSSLQGVGARATASGWILGVAQGSLDADTSGAFKTTITDVKGVQHTVYVARLPVIVKVSYYVAPAKQTQSKWIPAGLQELANSIAGRDVPAWEIAASIVLIVIGLLVAGMVVNSAIRGGVMAIGRQPIIRRTIVIKIMQSFVMALLLLAAAVGVVVLMLRVIF